MNYRLLSLALIILTMPVACSNAQKHTSEDVAAALPQMVIDRFDFDRNYRMPCAEAQDCTLPLTCNDGLCGIPPAILGTPNKDSRQLAFTTGVQKHQIWLEIADTPYTRQMGMMKRRTFAPQWGMLFIFANNVKRSFWMSHTYIPLDMVFIRTDGSVANFRENAAPLDEKPHYLSDGPVRYVLELPAGSVKKYGIDKTTVFDMSTVSNIKPVN